MNLLKFEKITPSSAPNADAIDLAEKFIEQVKSGVIRHIAVVGITADGSVHDGWSASNEEYRPFVMLGALENIKLNFYEKEIEKRA